MHADALSPLKAVCSRDTVPSMADQGPCHGVPTSLYDRIRHERGPPLPSSPYITSHPAYARNSNCCGPTRAMPHASAACGGGAASLRPRQPCCPFRAVHPRQRAASSWPRRFSTMKAAAPPAPALHLPLRGRAEAEPSAGATRARSEWRRCRMHGLPPTPPSGRDAVPPTWRRAPRGASLARGAPTGCWTA